MAELGSALALGPYLECAVVAGWILQHCPDHTATRAEIEAIVGGKHIDVLAYCPADAPSSPPTVHTNQRSGETLLSGRVLCVRYATAAHAFLVPAISEDGNTCVFRVARNSPGLKLHDYRLIDGSRAADLAFQAVTVGAPLPLAIDARRAVVDALEWGVLASVAETVGIVSALNSATFAYLMTRKQFGTVIGSFQALQHRAADMHIAAEEALAMADATIDAFASEFGANRSALVSAAKAVADAAARRIGAEAVQLHGGMGVSDDLIVSHYARRLLAIRYTYGSAEAHQLRFRKMLASPCEWQPRNSTLDS
jgi:alkylation response protein AidB-like acyl-CoA dehydrogenase